SDVAFRGNLLD
nr:Chain B, Peptide corresponding to the N-terminal extension of protein PapK1N12_D Chain D, Peptide corresponding to the N-terminal extension of protein PapK